MSSITLAHIAQKIAQHRRQSLPCDGHRKASVLVTLVIQANHLHLLLTKRTDTVEHHKGQISFPGGMVDERDESETATALREAEEEIGIPRSMISILGTLDDIQIPSGFIVTPVVGVIDALPELKTNSDEVAEVLIIPLEKFLDPSVRRMETRVLLGAERRLYFYDVWREPVWGATAHIIKQFADLIS